MTTLSSDAITEALAASRELNAAMAFGVPEEAWDDCRRGIAAALVPVVAQHVEDARRDEREGLQNAIDAMVGEMHDLLNDCDQTNDPNAGVRVWAVREVLARYRVTTEQLNDTDWAAVARAQQEMDEDAALDDRIARAEGGTP